MKKLLPASLTLLAPLSLAAQQQAQTPPNIIYIMCDDMGYGDLGCYGQTYIETPHIDRMASEGIRFTQAYCGSPVSAPSRCCFMTGQHSGHTRIRGNREHWRGAVQYGNNRDYAISGQEPYDSAHVIIPEILKDNGYTTGMFGKWAAGYEGSHYTPNRHGIDEYYGYICQFQAHLYYPNFLNRYSKALGDTAVVREILTDNILHPMHGERYKLRPQYAADLIHERAMQWLEQQTPDQPFLGIFTYTLPHAELAQPNDSIVAFYKERFTEDKTWGGDQGSRYNPVDATHTQFAAMITRLDKQVGEILDLLQRRGLAENTIVFFTSDNGPHAEGGADPAFFNAANLLRGIKRTTYEGGIRVPFIAWGPGIVPSGIVSSLPIAFYDMMPTFCDLAGIDDYEARYRNPRADYTDYFDGISIAPTLRGEEGQQLHPHLYWELGEANVLAVRRDHWKLVVRQGNPELYNLANDLHEDHDVKEQYPEILSELIDIVYQEHVDNPLFPITLPPRN